MQYLALGLNHSSAPLAVRELLAINSPELPQALAELSTYLQQHLRAAAPAEEADALSECAIISTCNRTELYMACGDIAHAKAAALQWLSEKRHIATEKVAPYLFERIGADSVSHLFAVAGGLDSMVLGEPQILGQVKESAQIAQAAGTFGRHLQPLFERSYACAKAVRSQTEIGQASVSMAATAVRLAQRLFGDLRQRRVLFIGAGEMIELCATHFAAQSPAQLTIANRSLDKAQALAAQYASQCSTAAIRLSELPAQLAQFDVVLSCTASSLPIVGLGLVKDAIAKRKREPLMMVDLAVPRDIEPQVAQLADVYLYTVDDLGALIAQAQHKRQASVDAAKVIVAQHTQAFSQWQKQRELAPQIAQIHADADTAADEAVAAARAALARGEDPEAVLHAMAYKLKQKLLHPHIALLRSTV